DIAFYDDALLVNAERHILPILSLVRERGLKARFHTPNGLHARFVTPEVAHTLRASGFETVRLSLETADPARQSATGGKVSSDELAQALAHLHAAGYPRGHAEVYVMMAMPGQSYGEVVESMKLVHHAGARVRLAQYSPIPGTPDGDQCIRSLGLPPDEPLLHNKSAFPALLPDLALDRQEQLKSIAKSLNAAFGHSRCIY
ncbi:MAG: radical SAM protein, partial [Planctomycetes bacterium]|nr:radical SAM protein [Planctomycetota bacterium]